MNEHEMLIALKSYINGVIGGNEYYATIDVKGYKEFEKKLSEMVDKTENK